MTRIPGTTFTDNDPCIKPENFMPTLYLNVFNARLSDKAFREFVKNTLPIVTFERPEIDVIYADKSLTKAKRVFNWVVKQYPGVNFGLGVLQEKGTVYVRQGRLDNSNLSMIQIRASRFSRGVIK